MIRLFLLLVTSRTVHSQYGFPANISVSDVTEHQIRSISIDPGGTIQSIYPSTTVETMKSKEEVTTIIGTDKVTENGTGKKDC